MSIPAPGVIITFAISLVIGGAILSTPIDRINEVQTYYTEESVKFESTQAGNEQVVRWIFWHATEATYIIKNNDNVDGVFTLNFVFNNGKDVETSTKKIKILAGTQKAAKVVSTLNGVSNVTLGVVPPSKSVSHERVVTKDITGWDRIGELLWVFGK